MMKIELPITFRTEERVRELKPHLCCEWPLTKRKTTLYERHAITPQNLRQGPRCSSRARSAVDAFRSGAEGIGHGQSACSASGRSATSSDTEPDGDRRNSRHCDR